MESVLLFPLLFISLIGLLFLALMTYQKAEMFANVSTVAVQTAYAWGDSESDLATGQRKKAGSDGLYWKADQGLRVWFQSVAAGSSATAVRTGDVVGIAENVPELTSKKLMRAAEMMPQYDRLEASYEPGWFGGKIRAATAHPFSSPTFLDGLLADQVTSTADAWTIDPIEWIRGTQLLRSYLTELNLRGISSSEAERAIREYYELSPQHHFRYHRQAAPYLLQLVNGIEAEMVLQSGGKRLIDALDPSGVAHQAYVTFTTANLREQMAKDIELLEEGRVRGVVWHFFKREGSIGRTGPPEHFVQELQRNGIVVVLHE